MHKDAWDSMWGLSILLLMRSTRTTGLVSLTAWFYGRAEYPGTQSTVLRQEEVDLIYQGGQSKISRKQPQVQLRSGQVMRDGCQQKVLLVRLNIAQLCYMLFCKKKTATKKKRLTIWDPIVTHLLTLRYVKCSDSLFSIEVPCCIFYVSISHISVI